MWRLPDGSIHREDGPAITRSNGDKEWWEHNKRHRSGGPAVEYEAGTKAWWRRGRRHRVDGPAVTHAGGVNEWIVDGCGVSDETFLLDRLYAGGETLVLEHVLTAWHPTVDVSELVSPVYAALDRKPPSYVVAFEQQQEAAAHIRAVQARRAGDPKAPPVR